MSTLKSENKDGNLAIVKGAKWPLKMGEDFGPATVCEAARKKTRTQLCKWQIPLCT